MRHVVRTLSGLVAASLLACAATAFADDAGKAQEQANLKAVLAFYDKALNQKDADAAIAYMGDQYIQHNPTVEDGKAGFRKLLAMLKEKVPNAHSEVKQSFVQGDYVILHVHSRRDASDRGRAIVDIFRLDHGKIVEHWDVIQPVPETAANTNTMF